MVNSKRGFKQGYYTPNHPEKYIGDIRKIRYMSSWELQFNQFLDNNPNILRWASEEIAIPYRKPTSKRKNKVHMYYPDYFIEYKNKQGNLIKELIEIKPENQVNAPVIRGKSKKTQLYEQVTWAVNKAKWAAAQTFCDKYQIKFRILTEKQLFK